MTTATKTAVAGRFETHGDDFVHYAKAGGDVVARVEQDGTHHGQDFVSASGVSVNDLQEQVNAIVETGLPPFVDLGTF